MSKAIPCAFGEIADLASPASGARDEPATSWAIPQFPPYPGTQSDGLMESLAIGTGFDIAMVQQGLLPPSTDIEAITPAEDQTAMSAIETNMSADCIDPIHNDACTASAVNPFELNMLPAHHQHY